MDKTKVSDNLSKKYKKQELEQKLLTSNNLGDTARIIMKNRDQTIIASVDDVSFMKKEYTVWQRSFLPLGCKRSS